MLDPRPHALPRRPLIQVVTAACVALLLAGCGVEMAAPPAPNSAVLPTASSSSSSASATVPPAQESPGSESVAAPAPPEQVVPEPPPLDVHTETGAPPNLVAAARDALPRLPVKGRAPKTGYDRAEFGQAWSDDVSVPGGHNGCDTRNDILARDLQVTEFKPGTRDCVVLRGVFHDPYSGETVEFVRGQGTSQLVQIDHVVALSDAWQKGAQQLSPERRRDFANDPLNLQATLGRLNQQKGDGDAATWLPPRTGYRCEYVARQIVVKDVYGLWVTQAEHDAMARELGRCGP